MTRESVEDMKAILSELILNACVEDKADADALVEEITARIYYHGYAIEQGWRDIGSAPKDGTRVILDWGGSAVTGYYLDNSHTQWPWQGWKVPSMERSPLGQPTRWRPFPSVGGDA